MTFDEYSKKVELIKVSLAPTELKEQALAKLKNDLISSTDKHNQLLEEIAKTAPDVPFYKSREN